MYQGACLSGRGLGMAIVYTAGKLVLVQGWNSAGAPQWEHLQPLLSDILMTHQK